MPEEKSTAPTPKPITTTTKRESALNFIFHSAPIILIVY